MLIRPLWYLISRSRAAYRFHTSASSWASRKVLQTFKLADIGEGITECEVVRWWVCSGRTFRIALADLNDMQEYSTTGQRTSI